MGFIFYMSAHIFMKHRVLDQSFCLHHDGFIHFVTDDNTFNGSLVALLSHITVRPPFPSTPLRYGRYPYAGGPDWRLTQAVLRRDEFSAETTLPLIHYFLPEAR